MTATLPVFVVAGIGNGTGTGGAAARLFARSGYRVALIARNGEHAKRLAEEINNAGGEAAGFGSGNYSYKSISATWDEVKTFKWPSTQQPAPIRVALWNAASGVFKPFLDQTEEDLEMSLEANVRGAFAFSKQAISTFKENELDEHGARGTLLFTGGIASVKADPYGSSISAGKSGLRSLAQSLAKEFGRENIHVAHAIIAGWILSDLSIASQKILDKNEFIENQNIRLDPENIAASYLYLVNQGRSAWTWELDLRPAHQEW
ncbi:short-chain dehydrogenase/reductase SDR [Irpex rosettiformis]|uniref:Short-chain dehydrogenase/reductase SDR n=1 Tax=Irpex rosettiformis TaxID=378272 RepID=A0ACB8TVU8_9APHY|nr:short-chain dehydrogenase/reductase SDR [Irpex rosettiformis]